jgi:hypothetical protein
MNELEFSFLSSRRGAAVATRHFNWASAKRLGGPGDSARHNLRFGRSRPIKVQHIARCYGRSPRFLEKKIAGWRRRVPLTNQVSADCITSNHVIAGGPLAVLFAVKIMF